MTSKYHSSFVMALKSSFFQHMCVYEAHDVYCIAAVLNLRFKLLWRDTSTERSDMKKHSIDHAVTFKSKIEECQVVNPTSEED